MSPDALTVAVIVLGIVVALLLVMVLALARQIGILHTRLAPAGALMNTGSGLAVGADVPPMALQDIEGRGVTVGGPATRARLLLFTSPTCPLCRELLPVARSLVRSEKLDLLLASDGGSLQQHRDYVQAMQLGDYPYLLSGELGVTFAAGKLPYAVLIDAQGVLRSRGLVNSREHLESLVESMRSGHESLQSYMVKEHGLEHAS